jgi:hypothetical protein
VQPGFEKARGAVCARTLMVSKQYRARGPFDAESGL